jgi:hypothetical protein
MSDRPDQNPSTWEQSPATARESHPPQAMLICDGLLGMCSPEKGKCEIGFLSLPKCNDQALTDHKPEITIIAVAKDKAEVLFRLRWRRKAPPFSRLKVGLKEVPSNARFLLTGGEEDFRKMIDLEYKLNNGKPVPIRRGAFSPLLEVTHGDFHTLLLTPQDYSAKPVEDGGKEIHLERIAFMTAADLHCDQEKGAVVLEIIGEGWVMSGEWSVKDRKIFVIVHNNCQDAGGMKCEDENSNEKPNEKTYRTDFYLYYEVIPEDIPENIPEPPKYNVVCYKKPTHPNPYKLPNDIRLALIKAGLIKLKDDKTVSTNPTPCGIAGFGVSSSLEGGG